MKDGSDAVADWPVLNALLNTASGASWVSFHHGGGVGMGNSLHAGQVLVADGTDQIVFGGPITQGYILEILEGAGPSAEQKRVASSATPLN